MKKIIGMATALGLAFAGMNASADVIEIEAANDGPLGINGAFSGFVITFDDVNDDGLLELGEILSFSGIQELGGLERFYEGIAGTPDIPGVSIQSGFDGGLSPIYWWLTPPVDDPDGWLAGRWTYTVSTVTAAVPEPGALALLGLGLLGIGVARRRRVS